MDANCVLLPIRCLFVALEDTSFLALWKVTRAVFLAARLSRQCLLLPLQAWRLQLSMARGLGRPAWAASPGTRPNVAAVMNSRPATAMAFVPFSVALVLGAVV